jgi:hypothetical protein
MKHKLCCSSCGIGRNIKELYRDLSVDLPDEAEFGEIDIDLEDLVSSFLSAEKVTTTCESCGASEATMRHNVETLPSEFTCTDAELPSSSCDSSQTFSSCRHLEVLFSPVHPHSFSVVKQRSRVVVPLTLSVRPYLSKIAQSYHYRLSAKAPATPPTVQLLQRREGFATPAKPSDIADVIEIDDSSNEDLFDRALLASLDEFDAAKTPATGPVPDDDGDDLDSDGEVGPPPAKYRLSSVISHQGRSMNEGHYVRCGGFIVIVSIFSDVFRNGKWTHFDDSTASVRIPRR